MAESSCWAIIQARSVSREFSHPTRMGRRELADGGILLAVTLAGGGVQSAMEAKRRLDAASSFLPFQF